MKERHFRKEVAKKYANETIADVTMDPLFGRKTLREMNL